MQTLTDLVEKFDRNLKQYRSTSYDEANVRVDFIDKLFETLGWDVRNEKGYSEDYREVVREDKVVIQGKPKAPDYSFRIGGVRKFFVEAKKPSVDIRHAASPAFQIRRYAYTAKLPLSILTDFEELAVYDTRIKPDQRDDASVGRIFYCKFIEYEKKWEYLKSTFSPDAIQNGSFDKYISDKKRQKGTSEVDKEFLKTIDEWRVELAKTIAKNNKDLETYDINYAVQKIIDRMIFLRFAEDQNIEEYGSLKKFLEAENKVYPQLDEFFKKADVKYNSSLFKPEKTISDLTIADKTLHSIIRGLYYPKCPYEFSVLPIEILGSIYEKFLGKTIRLTASHQAKVEEKPEVRKAGGVYYTPQYIVDYIVENTVGEKLKGRKPSDFMQKTGGMVNKLNGIQVSLKILDPACGSGSFLVRAYDYLLKWYLEQYTKGKKGSINNNIKKGRIYQTTGQNYRLSILTKQEILKQHIYGVDIDRQAVEVTKLSLLLKLMEGESEHTTTGFFRFDHAQRLLPDLSTNIKCGNSLIGSDFYKGKNLSLFDTREKMKINVFDWDGKDGFPEIMKDKKVVKDWKTYHITWVTYGSRVSEQMVKYGTVLENPVTLSLKSRQIIVDALAKKIKQTKYRVLSCSVLSDHVHCILVCTENDISDVVHDLKGYSSHAHNRQLFTHGEGRQTQLWAKGSHKRELKTQEHTKNAIDYVWNNHHKHGIDAIDDRQLKQFVVNYDTAYAPIEEQGGFDVVIGNPPYGFHQIHSDKFKAYFHKNFISSQGSFEHYFLFYEKSLSLLKKASLHGYIVPVTWLTIPSAKSLRKLILSKFAISKIIWLPELVFDDAKVNTLISVIKNNKPSLIEIAIYEELGFKSTPKDKKNIDQGTCISDDYYINIFENKIERRVVNKLYIDSISLSELARPCSGYNPYEIGKGISPEGKSHTSKTVKEKPYHGQHKKDEYWKPEIIGRNLSRYHLKIESDRWVKYGSWLAAPRDPNNFLGSRILVQEITGGKEKRIIAAYYKQELYHSRDVIPIKLDNSTESPFYLLAIINSKLFSWLHHKRNPKAKKGLFPKILVSDLKKVPIKRINLDNNFKKSQHDKMVSLVDQMLVTQKYLHETTSPIEKKQYQQEANILDKQIDQLVYELYELTPEEIKIVEGEEE